jgi:hypothetical protein
VKRLANALVALLVATAARPASAQTPLTVGSVRDQRGEPVAGADVAGLRDGALVARGATDAAGTFALEGPAIGAVRVTCRFCASARVAVSAGQPVIIVVRRYQALFSDAPTADDLANLPYARVDSAIALRPFTLLAQTSTAYPGANLSDRGLSQSGSLFVDDGNPVYDIAAGSSPYAFVPAHFESSVNVVDAGQAYLYGNRAGGGSVVATPFGDESDVLVAGGGDAIARLEAGTESLSTALATFSNDDESRQRGDVSANFSPGTGQTIALAAGSEQGRSFSPIAPFAGSYSFTDATYSNARLANLYVSATTDRGNDLFAVSEYGAQTVWSDAGVEAGVHSDAPISAFADIGVRASSGTYATAEGGYVLPAIGASFRQLHSDAGITAGNQDYNVTAGVGAFWLQYQDGPPQTPLKAALALPSLQAQLFPNGHFGGTLEAAGSFTLPTFEQLYSNYYYPPTSLDFQRNTLQAVSFDYTDASRVRVALEASAQRVAGSASGTISSAGVSATWQIAPSLSLRAWTMHVSDTVPSVPTLSGYPTFVAPTENAAWLTYDANGSLRFDAIYRRDLLDGAPFYHVDGDISGPIAAHRLRWYAGVEDRLRRTFLDVGLRLGL